MPSMYETVIAATTAAVSTKTPIENNDAVAVTVCADNLATTETVPIWIDTTGTGSYKQLTDTAGNALKLTASIPALTLEGGPRYAVTKDATAGNCAVTFVYSTRGF